MSSALLRRNSSKQGLQNLLRITTQRSMEDAEEIERERRRRAREALQKEDSISGSAGSPQDSSGPTEKSLFESELKPSSSGALEEDEGFSDWTQRLERGRQIRQEETESREADLEVERTMNEGSRRGEVSSTILNLRHKGQGEVEEVLNCLPVRKRNEKCMLVGEKIGSLLTRETPEWKEDLITVNKRQVQETKPHIEEKVKDVRKEVKVSYTSKVFLQQDRSPTTDSEDRARGEVTPQLFKSKKSTSRIIGQGSELEQPGGNLETEQKLEKIRRSHQEKESQELEQLRQRQAEAEMELEELKKRREERRKVREEEERRKEEEEQQRLAKEEEEKRRMKEDIERRRLEAAERRMKSFNMSSPDGDESFNSLSPKSPTLKKEHEESLTAESTCSIIDRTESLNRSLKKSNSFKKTQPPLLLSKIDDKLEQYTHAVESSSKEPKTPKSAVVDMPCVPEPVVAKKNLFEAGEAWSQSTTKAQTPSKDADGLKVGVADLITQWVKGSPEGSNRYTQSKQNDVKAGDVLQKKNMWEIIGEGSANGQSGHAGKGTASGKRYKFVVTGHGKYEKISIDDDSYSEYPNGDLCHNDL